MFFLWNYFIVILDNFISFFRVLLLLIEKWQFKLLPDHNKKDYFDSISKQMFNALSAIVQLTVHRGPGVHRGQCNLKLTI